MFLLRNLKRFFYKALKQPGYALKVFSRRLQASLYYIFAKGKSSYPEAVTLFLTHRCNLQCKMCGQWGREGVSKRQSAQYIGAELNLSELKSIIDDVAFFKPNITLFGGEPLLHPDCLELIKYIKERKMHCLMISNGSLLESMAQGIVDSGLDELNVSLDGPEELHDSIRGLPGLFARIMRGLELIYIARTAQRKKRPLINLQCTINRDNYSRLKQLIDVARLAHADSLTFHHLIFLNPEALRRQKECDAALGCDSLDWEGFVFEPGIDPRILNDQAKNILSGKYDFKVDFYPNFSPAAARQYYEDPCFAPLDYPARCLSPWIAAYVFPDAELKPCLNSGYSFGNLRQHKFSELWNNQKAVKFRLALKEKRAFPACVRCTEMYRY